MTTHERAVALLAGQQIDCPRCGEFPFVQGPSDAFGPGDFVCRSCGLALNRMMAVVCGVAGDDTAAIHLDPREKTVLLKIRKEGEQ